MAEKPRATQLHHAVGKQLKGTVRKIQSPPLLVPCFTEQPGCPCVGLLLPAPTSCLGYAICRCCELLGATAAPLPSPCRLVGPALTLIESA